MAGMLLCSVEEKKRAIGVIRFSMPIAVRRTMLLDRADLDIMVENMLIVG